MKSKVLAGALTLGYGRLVPNVSKLLFREGGVAAPPNLGNGYLVDDVTLASFGH